jgi:hypothetical protein
MIEVKIIIRNLKSAEKVKKTLTDKMLGTGFFVIKEADEIQKPTYILTGQTRAMLFEDVFSEVKLQIEEDLITIYSTPIVNGDWKVLDSVLYKKKSA